MQMQVVNAADSHEGSVDQKTALWLNASNRRGSAMLPVQTRLLLLETATFATGAIVKSVQPRKD
jgi:hypothetical protein